MINKMQVRTIYIGFPTVGMKLLVILARSVRVVVRTKIWDERSEGPTQCLSSAKFCSSTMKMLSREVEARKDYDVGSSCDDTESSLSILRCAVEGVLGEKALLIYSSVRCTVRVPPSLSSGITL